MQDAECNYDIHDKELLAVIQAFKEWKRYTRGSPRLIQVLTDHKNLVTFMSTKELSERQGRWQEFLSQYNFRIIYRPGKEGRKPDALTRRQGDIPTMEEKKLGKRLGILLPKETCWDIPEEEEIQIKEMELAEFQDKDEGRIQQAYNKDDEIQAIKKNLEKGVTEMKGVALGLCEWKDEHLWYQGKIWILNDEELRTSLIHKNHDNPLAGHGGTAKTTELVSRQYYWPGLRETGKLYVKNCDICQRSKVVRHTPYGMLQYNEVPDQPWKSMAMDFITELPISEGYDTILVVIDRLTKMCHFIPCKKNLDARQFATLFLEEIMGHQAYPETSSQIGEAYLRRTYGRKLRKNSESKED